MYATLMNLHIGNSHTSDSHVGHRTTKTVHQASSYIKRCLGGGPEDAILFCGSGSTGSIKRLQEFVGIAVPSTLRERMIKCMPSEERWVVLVGLMSTIPTFSCGGKV
ncbi:hypothetical protein NL676_019600 [Syzygium grande]|nr:hypothetical protein NL676_019600 [Syzygium grande]